MWANRKYHYPTREAFRYHFSEPPNAPVLHEENQRVKEYLLSDRSNSNRRMDYQERERGEFDYRMAPDLLRKEAPFGNNDTPQITMKIIGGRQVPVIEKHPTYNDQYTSSRIQPLQPIADKPNYVDPRTYGDMPGGYYNRETQEPMSDQYQQHEDTFDPTALATRRPDSKDFGRTQYRALPPIQQNRTRNDMSTVFEAEAWTGNSKPELAKETEYHQNFRYLQENGFSDMFQQRQQHSSDGHAHHGHNHHLAVTEVERDNVLRLLPEDSALPQDPIKLTRDQETALCKMVCNEMIGFDPKNLQDAYLFCSQGDRDLRGFCPLEKVFDSLDYYKGQLHPGQLAALRRLIKLIAAQFVDPNYPMMVNYEKIISFIGYALTMRDKGQLSNDKPKYYLDNGDTAKTGSIYHDREVAKLLRTVENELSQNSYAMDWTQWLNAFQELDRSHRETLSSSQIKDVCYNQKLPLSDSLINRILGCCEGNNKDGQYRWQSFLDFLSRVRPSNTGYTIPVSKRPLEYAKHFPQPAPTWPRADDSSRERRGYSPRREPTDRHASPQRGDSYRQERDDRRDRRDPYQERERGYVPSWQASSPRRSKTPPQRRSFDQRPQYEHTRPMDRDPYDRYMKEWAHNTNNDRLYRPASRQPRPLSYAEPPRQTVWKNGDSPIRDRNTPVRRHRSLSPVRAPRKGPELSYYYPDTARDPQWTQAPSYKEYQQRHAGGGSYRRDTYRGENGRTDGYNREDQIRQLSDQLRDLQTQYQVTLEGMHSNDKSWLDRYLKMAQALYNSDFSNKGCLPRSTVMDIVQQYNDAFSLGLDTTQAMRLASAPENLDKSNNVILKSFLANLSADRNRS